MRLTTKGRYGVRAMLELALNFREGPIPAKKISQKEGIPVSYLEQIFYLLGKAGLVKSVRGREGGFLLAKPPGKIKITHILEAVKESMTPVFCVNEGGDKECVRVKTCVAKALWKRLDDKIREVLNAITLKDLLEEAQRIIKEEK